MNDVNDQNHGAAGEGVRDAGGLVDLIESVTESARNRNGYQQSYRP
jgi:hypothetical protein